MPDFGRWSANGGDPSLNEINRTDRFLDALANQQPVYSTDPSEAELAQLMAGWRDELRTPPLMSPVTPRDAVVALTRAVESRKRTRTSMALVGSVAAAVLCLGGFGAVVAGAGPGDALYGLHTMLFGEQKPTRGDRGGAGLAAVGRGAAADRRGPVGRRPGQAADADDHRGDGQ